MEGLETLYGILERSLDKVAERFCTWRWRACDGAWLIGEAKDFASVAPAERDVRLGCTCRDVFKSGCTSRRDVDELYMLRDVAWLHLWREIVGRAAPVESIRYVCLSPIVALMN